MDEYLGNLELKEAQIPAKLKSAEVGSKMTMEITVEKTGINKREDYSVDMGPYKLGEKPKKRPKVMMHTFRIISAKQDKKGDIL